MRRGTHGTGRRHSSAGRRSAIPGRLLGAVGFAALSAPGTALAQERQQAPATVLPEIRVIATTPLSSVSSPRRTPPRPTTSSSAAPSPPPPSENIYRGNSDPNLIDRDKVPANSQTLTAQDLDHAKSSSLPEALLQRVPSVFITDVSVNPFQPDVQYRGFVASPVVGTPQGLAVYQNGVRINEAFGDTVNWDFIPEMAMRRVDLVPNNPVFGLNAIGGALSIEMKNGFNYQGAEAELRGGSFGRRAVAVQAGVNQDNVAAYVASDALNDDGWRDRSPSRLRRLFADVGIRGDRSEFHLNFTGASNFFGAVVSTPIELLNRRWSAVYTNPQTTRQQLAFLNATGSYQATDSLTFTGNTYFRGFWQKHLDGNTSDIQSCDPAVLPGQLCFGGDTTPLFGTTGPVADVLAGAVAGSLDRTSTAANTFGGSLQATSTTELFGHGNHFVVGASVDRGRVNFNANSELGTIGPDLFVTGTGIIISQPDGEVAPVSLRTLNTYMGLYATNTFDVTSKLSVTAGGRFNVAQITLQDQLGTALNGDHRFSRFNPVLGATYKITPAVTAYAGYSEANRAPTPAELGCSDPSRPCLLDNFLVSDPNLKQVVAHTYEAGLRGNVDFGAKNGRILWNLGAFRTDTNDTIINVPSPITGRGFFQNAGTTRRQGIEASASYRSDRWDVYATYSYIDATFRDPLTLSSPNNPFAVGGLIAVVPGDRIPSIPQHRFKAGVDYAVLDDWKVGANLIAVSGQFLRGDESNLNPMIPGYWIANLTTTYRISKNVEAFGLVQNLFNHRYYTFGAFFNTTQVPFLGLTDPRTLSPGAPLALYAGLRGKF